MKKHNGAQSSNTFMGGSLLLRKDGTFAYRPRIKVKKANKMYRLYKSLVYLFLAPIP